jgi:hypothetical protein
MGEALAFNKEWFTDSIMLGEESKELVLSLAGKSVCEISEMGSKKADRDKIKAMLSRTHDYGRPAYGRTPIERPRRNIFLGSTNSTEPLEDPTGNRRYLPVKVTREINLAWVRANVAQLIGEACHLESAGGTFVIPREAWKDAAQRQEASRKKSTAEDYIAGWFDDSPLDGETYEQQAQADDQFIMVTDLTHALNSMRAGSLENVATAMERLGYVKRKIRNPALVGPQWCWYKSKADTQATTWMRVGPNIPKDGGRTTMVAPYPPPYPQPSH